MFKFLVKVVIVVLALQSGMGYLKKEEILVGEMKSSNVSFTCMQSSLVGVRISACIPCLGAVFSMTGMQNATVLPEPVTD